MSTRLELYWAFGTWLSHVSLLSIEFRAGGRRVRPLPLLGSWSKHPSYRVPRNGYEREGLLLAHYPWPGPDCIRRREIVWAAGRVIEPAAKYGALVAAGIAVVLMLAALAAARQRASRRDSRTNNAFRYILSAT